MINKNEFRVAVEMAVQNVIKHGDTDIFPRSFESHAIFDLKSGFIDKVCEYDEKFNDYLARFPPSNTNALIPVSYFGFRWGTQLDPIWNVHFLSCVIALSSKIEAVRLKPDTNSVFSYRYRPDRETGDLFDRQLGWYSFMKMSEEYAKEYDFVTICDIGEFYPRVNHHRLENALLQIDTETEYPKKIMSFLANFSNTRSFGLPVGGPAARILSELTINQIDRLLLGQRIKFTRFADDFHLFARTKEEAYRQTIFISEKLFENQGLSLQKSKTRIMTASEFRATSPLQIPPNAGDDAEAGRAIVDKHERSKRLMRFSLRFDPYSPTAENDYEDLKAKIREFDIIELLQDELSKSRIHIALSRKLVAAIEYLDGHTRDNAVLSIVENAEILYPIFSSALMMVDKIFETLGPETKNLLTDRIIELIRSDSHVFRVDVHLCFALRVLQHTNTEEIQQLLKDLYTERKSDIVRRDIILIMALWGEWYWLSDLRNQYRQLSGPQKRSFLVASYSLKDEGTHWRKHIKKELDPFEKFLLSWADERVGHGKKDFPL